MITYRKINDLYALILADGIQIGHLERTKGGYNVEISYLRTFLTNENKNLIGMYVSELFKTLESRKRKRVICDYKLQNSILKTGFKIKE